MKVLYLHQHFATPESSSTTRSYEMAKSLIAKGHEVTMVYGKSSRLKSPLSGQYKNGVRKGEYNGIHLIELDLSYSNRQSKVKRFLTFLKFGFRSTRLAFKENFDVLFATSTPLTVAIPGIVMKWAGKQKSFVFETRDLWPEGLRAVGIKNKPLLTFMEFLAYQAYNRADSCIALSPGIKDGIKKRLKKEKPIALIPNGCDTDLFMPGKQSKSEILGLDDNCFVAIFTGAHGFANGLDNVLNAAGELQKKAEGDQIKLLFVGDGVLKDHLVKRAEDEQLDNCIFMDPVPKTDLVKIMQAADIGLMVLANYPEYYYGTSPNKFFDYIATGLPVLNNYPGWLAELITENKIGKAIEPDDPNLFAETLLEMKADAEELQIMGWNARKLAQDNFSREKLALEFSKTLEKSIQ